MPTARTPAALVGIDPTAPRDSQMVFHIKTSPERFTSAYTGTFGAARPAIVPGISPLDACDHLSRAGALPHAPEPPAVAPSIPAELVESWLAMHEIIKHFTWWLSEYRYSTSSPVISLPTPSAVRRDPIVEAIVTVEAEGDFFNILVPIKLQSGRRYEFITAISRLRILASTTANIVQMLATRLSLECNKPAR